MDNTNDVDRRSGGTTCYAPFYDSGGITIYHADCRRVLPWIDPVDLLLTDPPYGLGVRLRGGSGEWGRHFSSEPEWDGETVPQWLIEQAIDMAKASIVWGGNYYRLPSVRCWLSWDKMQEHQSGHFEMAWTTLDKPTRTYRKSRVEAYCNGKQHPTEKPVGLMQWCIGLAGEEVQTVLDPFMGVGTTLVAAKVAGKRAIGIEREERYCEIAAKRLAQGVLF